MREPRLLLFIALGLMGLFFVTSWVRALVRPRAERGPPTALQTGIGFFTNFFDTLGIGSYAPTTALFRFFRLVPDERIPGTMTLGHTLPTVVQAFIFIAIVKVDFTTLVALIAASILGAWLGAGVVARWPRRKIQLGMGMALCVAAGLFVLKNLDEMRGAPMLPGGDAAGLSGALLAVGIAGNFVLGALMTLGIGLYAPCLIMISLLGMDGELRLPDASGERAVPRGGGVLSAAGARPRAGRGAGGADRGADRQIAAAHRRAVARGPRRPLRRQRAPARGVRAAARGGAPRVRRRALSASGGPPAGLSLNRVSAPPAPRGP
ncbi:MAG: permease [Gemmatimonadetes bacterium]|nr:MAG: permease [Gemmatimonadota bacterium]